MQRSAYFIPKITRLRKLRSYWRKILRRNRLHLNHERLANLNPAHVERNIARPSIQIRLEIRKIGSELQEAYDNARQLREEFLLYLALKLQKEGLPLANAINAIAREEKLTATYSSIQKALKRSGKHSEIRLQISKGTETVDEM